MSTRPQNEEELQKREAIGVIRASRFVRRYAHSHRPINIKTICDIHREIFKDAWPEVAGKFREEELKITDSKHLPPHHSFVLDRMNGVEIELLEKLKNLEKAEGMILDIKSGSKEDLNCIEEIIQTAAWIHHAITFVHPFREGNGRTGRLIGNLILERYGLVGISIKVEKENKTRYRQALAQIDQMHDYEPLVNLIYEGLLERYHGVHVKYYDIKKKKH
jgi:fido (protein-threonine AMPylation protein)